MRHHVADYETYADAQRAVDALADAGFPVEQLTILGHGLRMVENVTGRRTPLTAVLSSAGSGLVVGAILGWFFGVFSWVDPLVTGLTLALYGALFGAVIGAVIGLIAQAAARGKRDFSSVSSMEATSYEVVATDAEVADRAKAELVRLRVGHEGSWASTGGR